MPVVVYKKPARWRSETRRRVHQRAFRLAVASYEHFRDELFAQLEEGVLALERIDDWQPQGALAPDRIEGRLDGRS